MKGDLERLVEKCLHVQLLCHPGLAPQSAAEPAETGAFYSAVV
jgi:hypothetical protein